MLEWIISASILIIVIIAGRYFLKGRVSRRIQYSLWLLAALRLLVPVSLFHSSLSIINLLPQSWIEQSMDNISEQENIDWPMYQEPAAGSYFEPGADSHPQQTGNQNLRSADMAAVSRQDKGIETDSTERINAQPGAESAGSVAGIIWLAGACILALWLAAVNGVFRYKVRRDRRIQNIPRELCMELSVAAKQSRTEDDRYKKQGGNPCTDRKRRRILPVYVTNRVGTPCMYGLFCPAVYITPQVAEDPWLFDMVLRHEMMHYRQGDHIWAMVRTLCLCIHWYNPLVWIAVVLSRQDGELACDEGVLRQLGRENRSSYGEALLALSAGVNPTLPGVMNLATSMSGTKHQLKERLSALVTVPQMAAGTAILVVLLSLGLGVCTFTSRAENQDEDLPVRTGIGKRPQVQESSERYGVGADGTDSRNVEAEDGDPSPIPSVYEEWRDEEAASTEQPESAGTEAESDGWNIATGAVYDNWDAETLEYYDEDHRPVAKVTEGDVVIKLTYVETEWSLSAMETQFSREILYWACLALRELEQWTGTSVTEVCYCVSEFGDFYFAQTPSDIQHDRIFYSRCYNCVSELNNNSIENIRYSTDMDVWYSPVKQYTTPPRYDKMTTQERLTWYFERSAIAAGSRVEEITRTGEGDYIIQTDQGTYYEFFSTDGIDTIGKGLWLCGSYDSYPEH